MGTITETSTTQKTKTKTKQNKHTKDTENDQLESVIEEIVLINSNYLEGRAYKNAVVNSNYSYFATCTFLVNMCQPLAMCQFGNTESQHCDSFSLFALVSASVHYVGKKS